MTTARLNVLDLPNPILGAIVDYLVEDELADAFRFGAACRATHHLAANAMHHSDEEWAMLSMLGHVDAIFRRLEGLGDKGEWQDIKLYASAARRAMEDRRPVLMCRNRPGDRKSITMRWAADTWNIDVWMGWTPSDGVVESLPHIGVQAAHSCADGRVVVRLNKENRTVAWTVSTTVHPQLTSEQEREIEAAQEHWRLQAAALRSVTGSAAMANWRLMKPRVQRMLDYFERFPNLRGVPPVTSVHSYPLGHSARLDMGADS